MAIDRHVTAPELLEQFRRGEQPAFLALYQRHGGDLRALVGRFFASPFEREEAAQEIWLQAHRMAAMYDPDRGPFLPWLRALAVNRCKELLRARGRRPDPRAELDEESLVAGPESGADPHAAAQQRRVQQAVAQFAAKLSSEEAAVLQHSLLEDRVHDEAARMIGISARRCKYLRMKLLARAAADPGLAAVLAELGGSDLP